MNDDVRYFNFPIVLLEGFMIDSQKCLADIFDYAIYSHIKQNYIEKDDWV
jgi:hypothetical protein